MSRTPLVLLLAVAVAPACGGAVYTLPEPPPPTEQTDVVLNPAAERRALDEAYTDARRAVVGLYEAAGALDWTRFYAGLSEATQQALSAASADGDGAAVLASGTLGGAASDTRFDPIAALLLAVPTRFSDTRDGEEERETLSRKVIYVETATDARTLVVVREGDTWRLHDPLSIARLAADGGRRE